EVPWDTTDLRTGSYRANLKSTGKVKDHTTGVERIETQRAFVDVTVEHRPLSRNAVQPVTLRRTGNPPTADLPLWVVIRNTTEAISFDNYSRQMDRVLCGIDPDTKEPLSKNDLDTAQRPLKELCQRRSLPYNDADAYRLLKVATEAFLMVNCGVALRPPQSPFHQPDLDYMARREI